jgi:hypothetical protein
MSVSGPQDLPDDALVDLLIKQVTEGLSPAEQRELDVLDSAVASEHLRDFERAAAAIALAGTSLNEPPASLRALLEEDAVTHFSTVAAPVPAAMLGAVSASEVVGASGTGLGAGAAQGATSAHGASDDVLEFTTVNPALRIKTAQAVRSSSRGAWGWFAAAACLLLAVFGWLHTPSVVAPAAPDVKVVELPPTVIAPVVPPPATPPTPAEDRLALLDKPGSIKANLGATKDPAAAGVTGDAVWDPATQTGYLHFVGLATNDPQVKQYQIWIFDGSRDKRYPVDGGVFDVPADAGEVVIPIRAALRINEAKAFAVTVEKPGGVVVSALGHVVVLGNAG